VIYSEPDPERRRQDIERLKAGVADRDALRDRLHFTRRLESRATAATRPGEIPSVYGGNLTHPVTRREPLASG
jgi:hypothetical protein